MNTLYLIVAQVTAALADGTAAPAGPAPAGPTPPGGGAAVGACGAGGMSSMIPLLLMVVAMYFIIVRPQQKRAKEHTAMLNAIKKGDNVITRGGIIGKVTGLTDTMITLELQEKVRVRVLRSYVEGKHHDSTASAAQSTTSATAAESKN